MLKASALLGLLRLAAAAGVELVREGQAVATRRLPGLGSDLHITVAIKVVRVKKEVATSHVQRLSSR